MTTKLNAARWIRTLLVLLMTLWVGGTGRAQAQGQITIESPRDGSVLSSST